MLAKKVTQLATRTYVIRILGAIIGFGGLLIFISKLGPDTFGSFILFQGAVSISAIMGSLGIDMAVEKRISGKPTGPFLASALAFKLLIIIPIGTISLLLQPVLNSYFSANISHLFFPALITYSIGRTLSQSLRGELKLLESESFKTLQAGLFVVVSYSVLELSYGIEYVVLSFIFSWGVVDILMMTRIESPKRKPSLAAIRSLLSFMKHSAIIVSLSGPVYSWSDTLMIGLFLPTTSVTAYETAWRITRPLVMLSTSFSTTIFPQVSSMSGENKFTRIKEVIPEALTLSTILVLPAIAGALVIGEELLIILFDPALVVAYTPLIIILTGRAFESINDIVGPVITGLGHPDLVARGAIVQLLSNLLIGLLLIPQIGIVGGAIGTALSLAIVTGLNVRYLSHYIEINFPGVSWAYSGIYSFFMGILIYIINNTYPVEDILGLLLLIAVGIVVYFATVFTNTHLSNTIKLAIK